MLCTTQPSVCFILHSRLVYIPLHPHVLDTLPWNEHLNMGEYSAMFCWSWWGTRRPQQTSVIHLVPPPLLALLLSPTTAGTIFFLHDARGAASSSLQPYWSAHTTSSAMSASYFPGPTCENTTAHRHVQTGSMVAILSQHLCVRSRRTWSTVSQLFNANAQPFDEQHTHSVDCSLSAHLSIVQIIYAGGKLGVSIEPELQAPPSAVAAPPLYESPRPSMIFAGSSLCRSPSSSLCARASVFKGGGIQATPVRA